MPSTTFRFESGDISFELSGPESFVREHLVMFMPFVRQATRATAPEYANASPSAPTAQAAAATAAVPPGAPSELAEWYARHVPKTTRLSMQDHILVFALWMRTFKKYIFTSEDIRRAFDEIGETPPKSLLQILGTLKRDHNLILGTERRGEYMLNTTGIERARTRLGLQAAQ